MKKKTCKDTLGQPSAAPERKIERDAEEGEIQRENLLDLCWKVK